MKSRGLLIVVSGPSGAGKGTICKSLLQKYSGIQMSISATTRKPRVNEEHGINYSFIEKDDFVDKINKGEFLEHAKVYENYYGTPRDFVMNKINNGEDVLLEIDIQGALQVKEKYNEGVFIFILPPSMEELKNRIIGRGSETEETLRIRYSSAIDEISFIKDYDYFVINDTIESATKKLMCIIKAEKCKVLDNMEELINEFKEEIGC